MCLSPQTDLLYWEYQVKRNWERDKTEKTIYRNKKANHLSTYRGSEGGGDHFWEEKAKVLKCFHELKRKAGHGHMK